MIALPSPLELQQRTKALAALDLILSPEWEYRYYSFNSQWSSKEQMASMRNGCGDEWWMVFHQDGWTALKGINLQAGGEDISSALQNAFPPSLRELAQEPAFRWDSTGFAYYHLSPDEGWRCANESTPFPGVDVGDADLLQHLTGTAADYAAFASDYYERSVALGAVEHIFALGAINEGIVKSLNPDIRFEDVSEELRGDIDYPA